MVCASVRAQLGLCDNAVVIMMTLSMSDPFIPLTQYGVSSIIFILKTKRIRNNNDRLWRSDE